MRKPGRCFIYLIITFAILGFAHSQPIFDAKLFSKNQEAVAQPGRHFLILSALPDDPALIAIERELNRQNKSYKTLIATRDSLTDEVLFDENGRGLYSGVILTEGNLVYFDGNGWRSAFDAAEWERLWAYEKRFKIRQLSLYSYPGAVPEDYGLRLLRPIDTSLQAYPVRTTAKGKEIFGQFLDSFALSNAYAYLSVLEPVVGIDSSPLIVDASANVLAVFSVFDTRERIALTMSHSMNAEHSQKLLPGLVEWLSLKVLEAPVQQATRASELSLEYIVFLLSLITLAILLASWLAKRYQSKRRIARRPQMHT